MSLDSQTIELLFNKGADTKTDPRLMDGKLAKLVNLQLDGKGTPGTRNGCETLASAVFGSGSVAASRLLAQHGDKLLVVAGAQPSLFTYGDALDKYVPVQLSRAITTNTRFPGVASEKQSIVHDTTDANYFDACKVTLAGGDALIVVYQVGTTTALRYLVIDIATGAVLKTADLSLAGAMVSTPRVFSTGLVYSNTANLTFRPFDTTTLTYGAAVVVRNNMNAAETFDACLLANGNIFIAYRNTTPQMELLTINASTGAAVLGPVIRAVDPTNAIAVGQFSNTDLLVGYGAAGGVFQITFSNAALAFIAGPVSPSASVPDKLAIGPSQTTGNLTMVWTIPAGASRVFTATKDTDTTLFAVATAPGFGTAGFGYGQAGKPFLASDGKVYIPYAWGSSQQSSLVVADWTGDVVAHNLAGNGGGDCLANPSSVVSLTDGDGRTVSVVVAREQGRFDVRAGKVVTTKGLALVALDFARNLGSVELGGLTYFAGARTYCYDGRGLVPMGLTTYPEGLVATNAAVGALSAGTYSWVAIFEWVDAKGVLHRSSPASSTSLTLAAGRQVTVAVPVPADVLNATGVLVYLYRTAANGTIFYNVPGAGAGSILSAAADTVVIADNVADATLLQNEVLYTTGGVLENMPLPANRHLSIHQNRLFAVCTDTDEIAFTQPWQQGDTVAPASHELLRIMPPAGGGKLIATAPLDDRLIVFRENKILVVSGQGPNALGLDGTYNTPVPLPGDIGCVNAASIVEIPGGLIFQSAKGLYLLTRTLDVNYLGADVEAYNAETVVAAANVESLNQARFMLPDGEMLVFNYEVGQWAVFTEYSETVGMCNWRGRFVRLDEDGKLLADLDGDPADPLITAGAATQILETAWVKVAGIAGFQRVRWVTLLQEWATADLGGFALDSKLEVLYNYEEIVVETLNFQDIISNPGTYQIPRRHKPSRQKCIAIKLRLTTTPQGTATLGRFPGMRLEVAVKPGVSKIPSVT